MRSRAQEWQLANDRRHYFLDTYRLMTSRMQEAIAQGHFHDSVWIHNLLERFAQYYFDSLEACATCAVDRPRIWEFTFRATRSCRLHVMQYILLGVNAHINYDLVLTLRELLADDWAGMPEAQRLSRHQDHLKVNTIIAQTIDQVQDEIIEEAAPFMDVIDRIMGRADEYLLSKLIENWRNIVWDHTMQMLADPDAQAMEQIRLEVERRAFGIARKILLVIE